MVAEWFADGTQAALIDGDRYCGTLKLIDDWHDPGSFEGRPAWIVFWPVGPSDIAQRLVKDAEAPAELAADRARLAQKGFDALRLGVEEPPPPFGFATTGLGSPSQLRDLVELTSHALQSAAYRAHQEARNLDEHAGMRTSAALVEAFAWLRVLDELAESIWGRAPQPLREAESAKADRVMAQGHLVKSLHRREREDRERTGQPYSDWAVALAGRHSYVSRDELRAFRWLAGKTLHFGPLATIELRHYRQCDRPQWRWRVSDEIVPAHLPEARVGQRSVYDKVLAGRSVLQSLQFFEMCLELEFMLFAILSEPGFR